MEPFSVAGTCIALAGTITKTSVLVNSFIRDVRAARSELDAIARELLTLKTVLELLAEDFAEPGNKPCPETLQTQITGILTNCSSVITDIEEVLSKHEGSGLKRAARWATMGKDDMSRLRSNLEAHKSALEIALDFVSMTMMKDIKADTREIRNDTSMIPTIKDDTAQILTEIARLQQKLPEDTNRQPTSSFMLHRYLDNLTSYAESVCEPSSDGCQLVPGWEGSQHSGAIRSRSSTSSLERKNDPTFDTAWIQWNESSLEETGTTKPEIEPPHLRNVTSRVSKVNIHDATKLSLTEASQLPPTIRPNSPDDFFCIRCNQCDIKISDDDQHYHCNLCHDDDFDLCQECVNDGAHCEGKSHRLVKRRIRHTENVTFATEPPEVLTALVPPEVSEWPPDMEVYFDTIPQNPLANNGSQPKADPWQRQRVTPQEVQHLLRLCTKELKTRVFDYSFLLPTSVGLSKEGYDARKFIRKFFPCDYIQNPVSLELQQFNSAASTKLTLEVVSLAYHEQVLFIVVKWCWSRLPGGVVTWKAYNEFREKQLVSSKTGLGTFSNLINMAVDNLPQANIVLDFFDLLASMVATSSQPNSLAARSLIRMAGRWAFGMTGLLNNFEIEHKRWFKAADATTQLFFSYLQSMPKTSGLQNLHQLLQGIEYPFKMPSLSHIAAVRFIVTVNSLSSTPWALIRRAYHAQDKNGNRLVQEVMKEQVMGSAGNQTLASVSFETLVYENLEWSYWADLLSYKKETSSNSELAELQRVSEFEMETTFWQVWLASLSPEEPAERNKVLRRCAIVKTIRQGWVVIEEQLKTDVSSI